MNGIRYLLDTNILSEPLRPRPNSIASSSLRSSSEELATASVAYHEICFGCQRLPNSSKRRAIAAYLQEGVKTKLVILPYDVEAAEWFAIERARLVGLGCTPCVPICLSLASVLN